jgi:hypothetical protein
MILREEVCAKGGTKMEERIGGPAAGGAHSPSLCDSYGLPASRRMVRI